MCARNVRRPSIPQSEHHALFRILASGESPETMRDGDGRTSSELY